MLLDELKRFYSDKLHEIERLEAEREALLSLLDVRGIDYSKDKVQTSPSDKMSEIIAKAADKDSEIRSNIGMCEMLQGRMVEEIKKCSDEISRTILINRYLLDMQWQEIADSMNYSRSTILRKAYEALKQIEG